MKGVRVRSTMPPLKRKITAGSSKRRVEFNGGPWDLKRAWLSETVTDTGTLIVGKHRGQYKYSGVIKSYGRRTRFGQAGPHYAEFVWNGEYIWND